MKKLLSRRGLIRLWLTQIGLTLLLSALCAIVFDVNVATSALIGAIVCIIPHAYFANKVFQYQGAQSAKRIVSNLYKGEACKIVLSAFLFAAVFSLFRVKAPAFFTSYIIMLMTHWFAPCIIVNKLNRPIT